MIYIREHFNDPESVTISVDGLLTKESVQTLKEIILHHMEEVKAVSVNLKKVNHISREGKAVLREFEDKITLIY